MFVRILNLFFIFYYLENFFDASVSLNVLDRRINGTDLNLTGGEHFVYGSFVLKSLIITQNASIKFIKPYGSIKSTFGNSVIIENATFSFDNKTELQIDKNFKINYLDENRADYFLLKNEINEYKKICSNNEKSQNRILSKVIKKKFIK